MKTLNNFVKLPREVKEQVAPVFFQDIHNIKENDKECLRQIAELSPETRGNLKKELLNANTWLRDEIIPRLQLCTIFADVKYEDLDVGRYLDNVNVYSPPKILKELRDCLCNEEEKSKFDKDWDANTVSYPKALRGPISVQIAIPLKDDIDTLDPLDAVKRVLEDDGAVFKKIKTPGGSPPKTYFYENEERRSAEIDNISKWLFGVQNGVRNCPGNLEIRYGYAILPGNSPREVTDILTRLVGDQNKGPLTEEIDDEYVTHRMEGDADPAHSEVPYTPEQLKELKDYFEELTENIEINVGVDDDFDDIDR